MTTFVVPLQSPSPRVHIRSLSFDLMSERTSMTPVEEGSPLSKSTGSVLNSSVPGYATMEDNDDYYDSDDSDGGVTTRMKFRSPDVLPPLNTKMSDDSMLSDALSISSSPSPSSSVTSSPSSSGSSSDEDSDEDADTPLPPGTPFEEATSQQQQQQRQRPHPLTFSQSSTTTTTTTTTPITTTTTTATTTNSSSQPDTMAAAAASPTSPFLYQDTSCPMYSPWLVCAVLDMHDVRRLDWMSIVEPIERIWGVRTSSADVLGILSDNGRVRRRRWWD